MLTVSSVRKYFLSIAVALFPTISSAQNPPNAVVISPEDLDRMAEVYDQITAEGPAWIKVEEKLKVLYRKLRQKGVMRRDAVRILRRAGIAGVEIEEYGQEGQDIRHELNRVTQYAMRKYKLSEPVSAAETLLDFYDAVRSVSAAEMPDQIHLAIVGDDGNATTVHSESLYQGAVPRRTAEFSKLVDANRGSECTVETMYLTLDVYFTVTCRGGGKNSFPLSAVSSECSTNDGRMKPARLTFQVSDSSPSREVLVWCTMSPR
jgi:hypothetical protein